MTAAPSSPVPAVEAAETEALRRLIASVDKHSGASDLVITTMARDLRTIRPILAAALTPAPGRAAEPDTMGDLQGMVFKVRSAAVEAYAAADLEAGGENVFPERLADLRAAEDALLSAVRTIVTERDEARADAERAEAERDELRDAPWPKWVTDCLTIIRRHSGYDGYDDAVQGVDLPAELEETLDEVETRAETAEAQLATLRAEVEGLRGAASEVLNSIDDLISDSEGVYGLHRNGDPAPWSELTEGGRYQDWLLSIEPLRTLLSTSGADR